MMNELVRAIAVLLRNSFCPTGDGGGVDPTCSPSGGEPNHGSLCKGITKGDLNMCFENARKEYHAQKKAGKDPKYVVGKVTGSIRGAPKGAKPLEIDHAWVEVDGKIVDTSPFRADKGSVSEWLRGDRKMESAAKHWASARYEKKGYADEKDLEKELDDFPKTR